MLRGHLDSRTVQQFFNGEDLDARVGTPPARRVVVTGFQRLIFHWLGWFFERDENAHRGALTFNRAYQIPYIPALDVAGFHLHQYPLGAAVCPIYEVDETVYALICALLAGLAPAFCGAWFGAD